MRAAAASFWARDRFGKKPLYYAVLPDGIFFRQRDFVSSRGWRAARTRQDALRLYFQFNYIPDPFTAYRAIRRLPAAGWMTYENGTVRQGRYWEMPVPAAEPAPAMSYGDTVVRVREKFDESVRYE